MKVNSYVKVTSWQEAYKLMKESPKNKILGGGLWLKKGNADVDKLIDLSNLGLDKIEDKGDFISIGALVTLRELEQSELVSSLGGGVIKEAVSQIVGPAFRNSATVGGTVYGKFGFSDLLTALMLFKVQVVFYPQTVINLDEYLSTPQFHDGVLTHIIIKKCYQPRYFKKVKYTSLDYPVVNIGIRKCKNYSVVVGARPGVAKKAEKASEYLSNGGTDFKKAAQMAVDELVFNDTVTSKGEYKKELARIYIERGLEEVNK